MKKEKLMKGNDGITLIALVITIIVLLILAGVVIATLSGENGILRRAGEASDNSKRQSFIEQAQLAVLNKEVQANGKTLTNDDLKDALKQYFTIPSDLDLTKTENKDVELTPNATNGYGPFASAITVKDVLGIISTTAGGGGGGETTGSLPTTSDYGDYVTGNVVSLGISGTSEAIADSNGNEWRIFHVIDGVGTFIIASDYVPVSNSTLTTAMDSSHANMSKYTIDDSKPFAAYWPYIDYLTHTSYDSNASTFLNDWTTVGYDNEKAAASLCNTTAWDGFRNNISGALAIGGPTLELYQASWNANTNYAEGATHNRIEIAKRADSKPYGYFVGKTANPTTTYIDMSNDIFYTGEDTLYYSHKGSAWNNCVGIWLASPSASGNGSCVVYVGCTGFVNGSDYYNQYTYRGLRPVVFLPSNVTLTEDNNVWTVGN